MKFSLMLFGLSKSLTLKAKRYEAFRERLKEKDFTAQIKLMDDSEGRYFTFQNGTLTSKAGISRDPDVCLMFYDADHAFKLLMPPRNQLDIIDAIKNFEMGIQGPDDLTS